MEHNFDVLVDSFKLKKRDDEKKWTRLVECEDYKVYHVHYVHHDEIYYREIQKFTRSEVDRVWHVTTESKMGMPFLEALVKLLKEDFPEDYPIYVRKLKIHNLLYSNKKNNNEPQHNTIVKFLQLLRKKW